MVLFCNVKRIANKLINSKISLRIGPSVEFFIYFYQISTNNLRNGIYEIPIGTRGIFNCFREVLTDDSIESQSHSCRHSLNFEFYFPGLIQENIL